MDVKEVPLNRVGESTSAGADLAPAPTNVANKTDGSVCEPWPQDPLSPAPGEITSVSLDGSQLKPTQSGGPTSSKFSSLRQLNSKEGRQTPSPKHLTKVESSPSRTSEGLLQVSGSTPFVGRLLAGSDNASPSLPDSPSSVIRSTSQSAQSSRQAAGRLRTGLTGSSSSKPDGIDHRLSSRLSSPGELIEPRAKARSHRSSSPEGSLSVVGKLNLPGRMGIPMAIQGGDHLGPQSPPSPEGESPDDSLAELKPSSTAQEAVQLAGENPRSPSQDLDLTVSGSIFLPGKLAMGQGQNAPVFARPVAHSGQQEFTLMPDATAGNPESSPFSQETPLSYPGNKPEHPESTLRQTLSGVLHTTSSAPSTPSISLVPGSRTLLEYSSALPGTIGSFNSLGTRDALMTMEDLPLIRQPQHAIMPFPDRRPSVSASPQRQVEPPRPPIPAPRLSIRKGLTAISTTVPILVEAQRPASPPKQKDVENLVVQNRRNAAPREEKSYSELLPRGREDPAMLPRSVRDAALLAAIAAAAAATQQAPLLMGSGAGMLPVSKLRKGLLRRFAAITASALGPPAYSRAQLPPPPLPEPTELNGFMIIEAAAEELPEAVPLVKLASRSIGKVEHADLAYFISLQDLDLSDNRLPNMQCLHPLPALRRLKLAANYMTFLTEAERTYREAKEQQKLKAGRGQQAHPPPKLIPSWGVPNDVQPFRMLESLDLSYNRLTADETLGVGSVLSLLPNLTELDLTANDLQALPAAVGTFSSLRILHLGENELKSRSLVSLTMLASLTRLNLPKNHIKKADPAILSEGSFAALEVLDLSFNKISAQDAIKPLLQLGRLRKLLLAGNPLAMRARAEAKHAREKVATKGSAGLGTKELETEGSEIGASFDWGASQCQIKLSAEKRSAPRLANVYASCFCAVPEAAKRVELTAAGAAAQIVATVDAGKIDGAISRVDNTIENWRLAPVPEESDYSGDEEDAAAPEDNTFLTGVGILEKLTEPEGEAEAAELADEVGGEAVVDRTERPLWEDVEDPTERMALAVGLDPRRLAMNTGLPTTDAMGAVNALRYVLSHPLVEVDAGLVPPGHYTTMTAAAKAKMVPRVGKAQLEPLKAAPVPPDAKMKKIITIESMLGGMKSRLQALEANLAKQMMTPAVVSHFAAVREAEHAELERQQLAAMTSDDEEGLQGNVPDDMSDLSENIRNEVEKERRSDSEDSNEDSEDESDLEMPDSPSHVKRMSTIAHLAPEASENLGYS